MRSTTPMPGNPWPHDMVLTVDDDHVLEDLIWVRHVYGLEPRGDGAPPPMWNEPKASREPLDAAQAAAAGSLWLDYWNDRLEGITAEDERRASPEIIRLASDPTVPIHELEGAIRHARGVKRWPRTAEQSEAWRQPFYEWGRSLQQLVRERDPEREIVEVTAAAWRRGLERIVEVPTVGEYTRTLSHRTLLVTRVTRADPEAYAVALESFDP